MRRITENLSGPVLAELVRIQGKRLYMGQNEVVATKASSIDQILLKI